MHEEYSALKKLKYWPALEERIPSSNHNPVVEEINSGGMLYFKFKSNTHLANNPNCPTYNSGGCDGRGGCSSRGGRGSVDNTITDDNDAKIMILLLQHMLHLPQYGSISTHPTKIRQLKLIY